MMGTLQDDGDAKQELDDSGCVHDETPTSKQVENGYIGQAELLDLSDDVLLYILKHCSPRDLKALGYTCPRLGLLILDHTLWQRVDARSQPCGRARVKWLLAHALNAGTKELMLSGYAREANGCLGLVNRTREEANMLPHRCESEDSDADPVENGGGDNEGERNAEGSPRQEPPYPLIRQHARLHFAETLPRFTGTPSWPDELPEEPEPMEAPTEGCGGPQFTLTQSMMSQLRAQCTELTDLRLEYCNINCKATGISQLPSTLRKLSLRGAKCYNLPLDKSFLFRIADFLPHLQYLDVSECDWLEPASLLPISKMTSLEHLLMRQCYKLSEFVAYASLACRYGFTNLKILDLRGSPVGDSEVSALGWVSELQELYLSPAPSSPPPAPLHKHYKGEPLPKRPELDQWEVEEPEYFKIKGQIPSPCPSGSTDTSNEDLDEQIETLRRRRLKIRWSRASTELALAADQLRHLQDVEKEKERVKFRYGLEHEAAQPEAARLVVEQPAVDKDVNSSKRKQENGNANVEIALPGPSPKRKKEEKSKESDKNIQNGKRKAESDSSDEENEGLKRVHIINVNLGASTSKISEPNKSEAEPSSEPSTSEAKPSSEPSTSEAEPSSEPTTSTSKASEPSTSEAEPSTEPNTSKAEPSSEPTTSTSKASEPSTSEAEPSTEPNTSKAEPSSEPTTSTSKASEPSTSEGKSVKKSEKPTTSDNSKSSEETPDTPKLEKFVRFRQNQDPVIVHCAAQPEQIEVEPRQHILYVNVGQQLRAIYRLLPGQMMHDRRNRSLRQVFNADSTHVDSASLVTDSAVRRFGRADGEDINVVHIGPHGPIAGRLRETSRPNRSNLRVLSITGYRHVTDRSLVHLATAAPHLRLLDLRGTSITERGIGNFRSLRQDCEVKYSSYFEKSDATDNC